MKYWHLLGLITISMVISSCEKKTTVVSGMEWHVEDLTVDKWNYSNVTDNNWYYAIFDCPALTNTIFKDGSMEAYLVDTRNGKEVQIKLPYIVQGEVMEGDQRVFYTEKYDCIFSEQKVEFTYTASDFKYEDSQQGPSTYGPVYNKFRIVFQW